jgi:hypothetical protein
LIQRVSGWCVNLSAALVMTASFAFASPALQTASASTTNAKGTQTIVLYAALSAEQFVNNRDDRQRGQGSNAFGNYRGAVSGTAKESTHGPLPGDEGIYAYNLFTNATLKLSAGSGVFICQYNFAKTGFCDVQYQLNTGSLIGVGEFSALAPKQFVLAITGGTGAFRSVKGSVQAMRNSAVSTLESRQLSHVTPALEFESQRLVFVIHRV